MTNATSYTAHELHTYCIYTARDITYSYRKNDNYWQLIIISQTVYHYTNEKGAKGIEKEKKIKASTDTTKDATFGPGNLKYNGMNREQMDETS